LAQALLSRSWTAPTDEQRSHDEAKIFQQDRLDAIQA
jgi:hypothetical protein